MYICITKCSCTCSRAHACSHTHAHSLAARLQTQDKSEAGAFFEHNHAHTNHAERLKAARLAAPREGLCARATQRGCGNPGSSGGQRGRESDRCGSSASIQIERGRRNVAFGLAALPGLLEPRGLFCMRHAPPARDGRYRRPTRTVARTASASRATQPTDTVLRTTAPGLLAHIVPQAAATAATRTAITATTAQTRRDTYLAAAKAPACANANVTKPPFARCCFDTHCCNHQCRYI